MNVKADPSFYMIWIVFLLLGKTTTVFTVFICGMLHEMGHICAYSLCGLPKADIRLTAYGISADFKRRTGISYKKEIICLLAGGLMNLITAPVFLIIYKLLPATDGAMDLCVCSLVFSILNLLPIYPLDGGRVIFSILATSTSLYNAKKITASLSVFFLVQLTAFAIYTVWVTGFNVSLLLICIYLFIYILSGK